MLYTKSPVPTIFKTPPVLSLPRPAVIFTTPFKLVVEFKFAIPKRVNVELKTHAPPAFNCEVALTILP